MRSYCASGLASPMASKHDEMEIFSKLLAICWGEFTGHRWILFKKASDSELWCFLWSTPEQTVYNRDVGELRRYRTDYVMDERISMSWHCDGLSHFSRTKEIYVQCPEKSACSVLICHMPLSPLFTSYRDYPVPRPSGVMDLAMPWGDDLQKHSATQQPKHLHVRSR